VVRARKRFGQHFLEPTWVTKVIRAIEPQPTDVFVEVGPGRGALTLPLAERSKAVVAYEIDRDLASALVAGAPANVTVVEGDFLAAFNARHLPFDARSSAALRAAGNLPYNVASPILFRLVEMYAAGIPVVDAIVMLQREVANRLLAKPGTKDYGVLTVLIGHSSHVKRLLTLPPGAFRPAPQVHSALVQLRFHPPDPPVLDLALFRALVQAVFTRRRKTLGNALAAYPGAGADVATRAGIDPRRRPETLTIAEFARLADLISI
jgi:16S rRNA (adenine1518-N6/adenine1519-N6)-dimethyltransferase